LSKQKAKKKLAEPYYMKGLIATAPRPTDLDDAKSILISSLYYLC